MFLTVNCIFCPHYRGCQVCNYNYLPYDLFLDPNSVTNTTGEKKDINL